MTSRSLVVLSAVLVLLAVVCVMVWRSSSTPIMLPQPVQRDVASVVSRADFVGAERCARCHASEYAAWTGSTHGRAGGDPAQRAIAPFNGSAIRFRNALVTPRAARGI